MWASTDSVRVIEATERDWERVQALRRAALATDPDSFSSSLEAEGGQPESFWRGWILRDHSVTLFAVRGGEDAVRDVGLAVLAPWFNDASSAGLYSLWVAPDARGLGVGDALIAAVVARAIADGYPRLLLEVGVENAHATRLYERSGFRPTGRSSALPSPREHIVEREMALDLRVSRSS